MESKYQEIRIVLVGKTGSGKSSTGNTILGQNNSDRFFRTDVSPDSVTKTCERQDVKIGEKMISVIDTPGQFDTTMSEQEMRIELEKCVDLSVPGPHVFLLTIKVGRFTDEEKNTVKWIQENFGEEAARYTIILFTHADQLKGKPLDEYIRENNDLQALVNECGGRFHSFNNEDTRNRNKVTELMGKIDEMVKKNGGQHYTNDTYRKAQERKKWEDRKQKAKDYGQKALVVVGGGALVVSVAGGSAAALAGAGRAATTVGAAVIAGLKF